MADNPANELASTLQSASINPSPDPTYDINPSTAASQKEPVQVSSQTTTALPAPHHHAHASSSPTSAAQTDKHGRAEIPLSILNPVPRQRTLPPLPDLRFEQSYLARIDPFLKADQPWRAAWATFLDHVIMPFSQGVVWNLMLFGWRTWNSGARFQGAGVGARVRRWWWRTNNWAMPDAAKDGAVGRGVVGERVGRWKDGFRGRMSGKAGHESAEEIGEFYKMKFGTAAAD